MLNQQNAMAKTLFLVHKSNREKIQPAKDEDIVFLDENRLTEKNSLAYYSSQLVKEVHDERYGYNTFMIQKWAFTRLKSGKSLAEELVFDDFTLWYPMDFFITCDFGQMGYELSIPGISFYIDMIMRILSEKKPQRVVVENKKNHLNQIIFKVCERKGIPCSALGFSTRKKSLLDRISNNSFMIGNYLRLRILLREMISVLFCKKTSSGGLLILTSDRLSNKENDTDYFWGPIVKELIKKKQSYKMVEYDRIEMLNSLANLRKRYAPQKYEAQFIGTYYSGSTRKYARRIRRFLRKKFKQLDHNNHFKASFDYKGIKYYDLMRTRLKKIFLSYSHYIADAYALGKAMIEKEKPKAVLIDHERNFYGRALICAAKNKSIPTIAFEGEAIYANNTYLLQAPIPSTLDNKSPLWRPLADKKLLWGEASRQWHSQKNFIPENKLMIIGAPKYDFLKELGSQDEKEIRTKYGLKDKEKLVTIFTAEIPSEEEFIASVIKSVEKNKGYRIIIKLHPLDTYQNEGVIRKLVKNLNSNALIIRAENCSKLIYASELNVTIASTLVYECILLNKNTIVYGTDYDAEQFYIKEGVVKICKTTAELSTEITNALKKSYSMPVELRKKFIRKYLYSDDCKSSERAVEEIQKHLKK